ncbi:hypothetical protein [Lacipirellula sp.]|uniref:hypothetical protein n=1 Tax=Lacipirellula sp. TaxID=2691419 RepID=UPI003D116103
MFSAYFEAQAIDCLTFQQYGQLRANSPHSWQLDATDAIVDSRWESIKEKLLPVVEFEVDLLIAAIENESRNAIERCRVGVLGFSQDEAGITRSVSAGDVKAIPKEFQSRIVTKSEAARFINGVAPTIASEFIE